MSQIYVSRWNIKSDIHQELPPMISPRGWNGSWSSTVHFDAHCHCTVQCDPLFKSSAVFCKYWHLCHLLLLNSSQMWHWCSILCFFHTPNIKVFIADRYVQRGLYDHDCLRRKNAKGGGEIKKLIFTKYTFIYYFEFLRVLYLIDCFNIFPWRASFSNVTSLCWLV